MDFTKLTKILKLITLVAEALSKIFRKEKPDETKTDESLGL